MNHCSTNRNNILTVASNKNPFEYRISGDHSPKPYSNTLVSPNVWANDPSTLLLLSLLHENVILICDDAGYNGNLDQVSETFGIKKRSLEKRLKILDTKVNPLKNKDYIISLQDESKWPEKLKQVSKVIR